MQATDSATTRKRGSTPYNSANVSISEIARNQYALVTRAEMIEIGLSDGAITNRLRNRSLTRVHHGVYSLVPLPLSPKARLMAALLACGEKAVLSHQSAAAMWGLLDYRSLPIHISRLVGAKRRPTHVVLHRPRHLAPWETTAIDQIPITNVARTLADLAVTCSDRLLGDAFSEARRRRLFDPIAIERTVRNAPARPGGHRLLELVERWAPIQAPSASPFQDRVFNICMSAGLPRPEQEVPIGPFTADFLWPEHGLILEADGRADHEIRFDEDRERDLYLAARGYQTIRVTYRMVRDNPDRVVRQIRQTLTLIEDSRRVFTASKPPSGQRRAPNNPLS